MVLYAPRAYALVLLSSVLCSLAGFMPALLLYARSGLWSLLPWQSVSPRHESYSALNVHLATVCLWVPLCLFQFWSGPVAWSVRRARHKKDDDREDATEAPLTALQKLCSLPRWHLCFGWLCFQLAAFMFAHALYVIGAWWWHTYRVEARSAAQDWSGSSHTGAMSGVTGLVAAVLAAAAYRAASHARWPAHVLHTLACFTCTLFPGTTRMAALVHHYALKSANFPARCNVLRTGGLILTPAAVVATLHLYALTYAALGPHSRPRQRAARGYLAVMAAVIALDLVLGWRANALFGCHWLAVEG